MFTYHGEPWDQPLGWQDEQDIEILSSSVLTPTQYNAAGIQLTNFHPEYVILPAEQTRNVRNLLLIALLLPKALEI
jgi:hypothetical protein